MRFRLVVCDVTKTLGVNEARGLLESILANRPVALSESSKLKSFEPAILSLFPSPKSAAWRNTGLKVEPNYILVRIKHDLVCALLPQIEDLVVNHGLSLIVCARPSHMVEESAVPYVWQKPYVRLDRQFWASIENPGPIAVSKDFTQLKPQLDSYLILARQKHTYMQTLILPESAQGEKLVYQLEYQEGSLENHWHVFSTDPTAVEAALHSYARGDDQWRTMFDWKRLNLSGSGTSPGV